MYHSLTLGLA